MTQGHAAWFSLNYPLVKNAGLLRGPYHWLDPCQVQPPTTDAVTTANWTNAQLFPVVTAGTGWTGRCSRPTVSVTRFLRTAGASRVICRRAWGSPSPYLTAANAVAKAVLLDHGRPIFEDLTGNHNQIGVLDVVPGANALLTPQAGMNVLDGHNHVIGRLRLDNHNHPDAIVDVANANNVIQRGLGCAKMSSTTCGSE